MTSIVWDPVGDKQGRMSHNRKAQEQPTADGNLNGISRVCGWTILGEAEGLA